MLPLGFQPIIDATVPGTHNYLAAGVVHHNSGKSISGCFELTAHLTGQYPAWWPGREFNHAIRAWAAGDTNENTRDILQKKLFGDIEWYGEKKGVDGSGMVPRELILQDKIAWKAGVPDLIDTVKIKHKLGGESTLGFRSYAQGRKSFQGTELEVVFFDEEPPMDCYGEALIRLMTTKGLAMLTFTPLNGWSDVVESFYPERRPVERQTSTV